METFVLAHEYAHILAGHTNSTPGRTGMLPAADVEALAYSWRQEFDADLLGMTLALSVCTTYHHFSLRTSVAGMALFFSVLDVFDRATALLLIGDEQAVRSVLTHRATYGGRTCARNCGSCPLRTPR